MNKQLKFKKTIKYLCEKVLPNIAYVNKDEFPEVERTPNVFYFKECSFETYDIDSKSYSIETKLIGDDEDGCEIEADLVIEFDIDGNIFDVICDVYENRFYYTSRYIESAIVANEDFAKILKSEIISHKRNHAINQLLENNNKC